VCFCIQKSRRSFLSVLFEVYHYYVEHDDASLQYMVVGFVMRSLELCNLFPIHFPTFTRLNFQGAAEGKREIHYSFRIPPLFSSSSSFCLFLLTRLFLCNFLCFRCTQRRISVGEGIIVIEGGCPFSMDC
jgi:hypothetical protein